jgi:hypothetical protein
MKKSLLVLGLSMIGNFVIASNELPIKEKTNVTACCTQTGSSGTPGTTDYMTVTITTCLGASTHADAKVAACAKASAGVKKSLELADVPVDLILKN